MKKYFQIDDNFDLIEKKELSKKKLIIDKNKINYFLIANFSTFGYYLITPLLIGIFLGIFFDLLLKTKKIFFTIGFLIGIIGIIYNFKKIYISIKK